MKMFQIVLVFMLLLVGIVFAEIEIVTPVDGVTVEDGTPYTSESIRFGQTRNEPETRGSFSIQVDFTSGTGSVKIEYLLSNDETNYVVPSGGKPIASGITLADDDNGMFEFTPMVAGFMKLRVTVTGADTKVTVKLCKQ